MIFDLVTFTLKFDLLMKNFNLGHNFLTRRDQAYIVHVYYLWHDLSHGAIIFDLVALTLKFDLLLKNFNHGLYLVMVAAASVVVFWQLLLKSLGCKPRSICNKKGNDIKRLS